MKNRVLKSEKVECIEDILFIIENSLQIRFEEKELAAINTFGELVDSAIEKLHQEDSDTCTSQQLFYKLKTILNKYGLFNPQKLTPNTELSEIFPKKNRKTLAKLVKKELGTGVDIVCLSDFSTTFFMSLLLGSVVVMVSSGFIPGIVLFILSMSSYYFVNRFTKHLEFGTVRELIEYIVFCEYVQSRKDKNTVNRKELKRLFFKTYGKELNIDKIS